MSGYEARLSAGYASVRARLMGKATVARLREAPRPEPEEAAIEAPPPLPPLPPGLPPGLPRPRKLLALICQEFRCTLDDLRGPRRFATLIRARQLAMFLLRDELQLSFIRIGQLLARDHTTAIHGCEAVAKGVKGDAVLAALVARLRSEMRSERCE